MRFVILGTGTGVGKTSIAEVLAHRLAPDALALKPIESGDPGAVSDALRLERACGAAPGEEQPYRFDGQLSPHLLARRSQQVIDLRRAAEWVERCERRAQRRVSLVESAGGVFSPLAPEIDNFDFAQALGPAAWLLVAANRLGVLHDVRAAWFAMQARGHVPDCVVLNQVGPPDESTSTNIDELRRFVSAPVLAAGPDAADDLVAWTLSLANSPGSRRGS